MAQVNLLPWREEARKQKKINFFLRVLGCVIATIFFIIVYHIYLDSIIYSQQEQATFLQSQLDNEQIHLGVLDKKNKELNAVEEKLQFIFSLRDSGFNAVRLLDEMVRVVPESVSLTKLVRENEMVTIYGNAQSNLLITQFMKNIAQSDVFAQPVLTEISVKENTTGEERIFALKVEQEEK